MEAIVKEARKLILEASYTAGACHIGSALSCVETLVDIYWNRTNPGDTIVFSKGSGVAALYSILAIKGLFPCEDVPYYLENYPLPSKEVPGVTVSVGSLGHGLPIAVGIALADRSKDVYCLISDGEINEGTTWESILFARHHRLRNLHVIVDRNWFQACGPTEEIIQISDVFWRLQGIFPIEVVYTPKGKGIDFMEGNNDWHYKNLTKEELELALKQI